MVNRKHKQSCKIKQSKKQQNCCNIKEISASNSSYTYIHSCHNYTRSHSLIHARIIKYYRLRDKVLVTYNTSNNLD